MEKGKRAFGGAFRKDDRRRSINGVRKNVLNIRLLNGVQGICMLSIVSNVYAGALTARESRVNFKIPFIFGIILPMNFLLLSLLFSRVFSRRTLLSAAWPPRKRTRARAPVSFVFSLFFFSFLSSYALAPNRFYRRLHAIFRFRSCSVFLFVCFFVRLVVRFFIWPPFHVQHQHFRFGAYAHFVHIIKLELKW